MAPDSRKAFVQTLIKLAETDDKVVLIVPDVGFNYIEQFSARFPNRFFNFGVTEQSTMVIAAGLALAGFKPYVYSMINFVIFRPYEQLRNAVCYHNANVKLIGVKGSEKYKFLGFSHNITEYEDINAVRLLPNITSYIAEPEQVEEVIKLAYKNPSPVYVRL